MVKVNPGSSFEQTMMGWNYWYFLESFMEIGPLVPEKKIFEGFFYHLRVWQPSWSRTQMPLTNFCSSYPRRIHIKFGFDRSSGFREEDVWNCGRQTVAGAWVYYKLTYEGRSKITCNFLNILQWFRWAYQNLVSWYNELNVISPENIIDLHQKIINLVVILPTPPSMHGARENWR